MSSKPFIINRIFNRVDSSTTAFGLAKYDPTQVLAVSKVLCSKIFISAMLSLFTNVDFL